MDADCERSDDVETSINEMEEAKAFPLDWSLKYKIRFTSTNSFHWCGTLKTLDEGQGLCNFVRSPGGGVLPYITYTGVCAAQRGRDFKAPGLERGIHFRGVF